jgi:hypothetical protein
VKGSANLYRTAISESGLGSPGTYSSYYNMSDALNYSNSVVQRLNCKNDDKQRVLSCIRNSSIQDLFQAYGSRYTRPIIDDYFFPLYPPLSIQNGTYNNISLIMGNNDYEQPICSQHPFMDFNEAVKLLTQSVDPKWLPSIIDYYHLTTCSLNLSANISRCCNLVRLILMDKIFDCDIRRLFNAFYSRGKRRDSGTPVLHCTPLYSTGTPPYSTHTPPYSTRTPPVLHSYSVVLHRTQPVLRCTPLILHSYSGVLESRLFPLVFTSNMIHNMKIINYFHII